MENFRAIMIKWTGNPEGQLQIDILNLRGSIFSGKAHLMRRVILLRFSHYQYRSNLKGPVISNLKIIGIINNNNNNNKSLTFATFSVEGHQLHVTEHHP